MHGDYHHGNLLQSAGCITGVIDWEGVETGDRNFDRFTLAFYSGAASWPDDQRTERLRHLVAETSPNTAALYLAHLSLRTVDWALRNETDAHVQRWLRWSDDALALIS